MDFHWITPTLAVGARLPPGGEATLATEHGFGAVVDLRDEDRDEAEALARTGVAFLHLPTPDRHPPSPADFDRGVAYVRERLARGERVLIHCQHGIGRSAVLALCVLVDAGADPLDALKRAKNAREAISPSEAQYEGWEAWLTSRGLVAPGFDAFGRIAYRHLAKA